MRELEKILKAFANHRRLEILRYLKREKEATVGDIADHIKLSFNATSKHLGILSSQDVVDKDQRSLNIYYSIAKDLKPAIRKIVDII